MGDRARTDGRRASDGTTFFVLGVDHPYAVKSDETPSLLPDGSIAVRFHSVGGWGAITTGKNLGAIIGELGDSLHKDIHISANPKYGSEKKGAPTAYFLVVAPERVRVNLRSTPRERRLVLRSEGVHAQQPARWDGQRRRVRVRVRRRSGARVGAHPHVGAKGDPRQEDPAVRASGFRHRPQGDRSARPAAADAGQRVPRRILRGVATVRGVRHQP
jgi:hypothetical protein